MPLRQSALPRHDAGTQALRRTPAMAHDPPTHLRWEAESLWQQLVPVLPHLSVEVLARCESTNSVLIERARRAGGDPDAPVSQPGALDAGAAGNAPTPHGRRGGDVEPCLLVAEQQTRGRGRLGRGWLAAPGTSLTFSMSLPLAPRDWSGLSLAAGLAIAEALDPATEGAPPRVLLKWPNDLWLDGGEAGKLGGLLIETVTVGRRRMCVVGVGLNVQPLPATLAAELGGHASVSALDPAATPPGVLARIAGPLVNALRAFEREGFAPRVAAYARRDLLRGRAVITSAAPPSSGQCEGVDELGALLVRADGQLHRIVSGEVSVRPVVQGPAAATRPGVR
ncbi:MAG: biotin--[acetyl-CoA-carboxylase] ligase [Rubrivivax sp.]|nr:biotin--[acetyl-CoA-carboxylase] ligase [Rubrivivax sp.]